MEPATVTVTFAGSGDAFGSGGRHQACIHLRGPGGQDPVLLDCGTTSLAALHGASLDPGEIAAVFVSHLHGDHFGGLPFLILDGQFTRRARPLTVTGPPGTGRRLAEAMECLFPGSSTASRRFAVEVVELAPGGTVTVAGVRASGWQVDHPSGAPPLAVRLGLGGRVIGYTGDTAWTGALLEVADGADLLIAEAYRMEAQVPYHLRHADLLGHREQLNSGRVMLTHMGADVLGRQDELAFERAHDGLTLTV